MSGITGTTLTNLQYLSKPFTRLNPELTHDVVKHLTNFSERSQFILNRLTESFYLEDPRLEMQIGDVKFKNPVGIAAGLIKEPHGLKFWEALGVGFETIGGITMEPQSGNKKPRIFRIDKNGSIVNGMGLPNLGVIKIEEMLEDRRAKGMMPKIPLIANLCNGVETMEADKLREFEDLMTMLAPFVSGFEINISCPNQQGVGKIQEQEDKLRKLLTRLEAHRDRLSSDNKRHLLMVKVAPLTHSAIDSFRKNGVKDLSKDGLKMIARVCNEVGIDCVVATNTSQEHDFEKQIKTPDGKIIYGGLSGQMLHEQSYKTAGKFRKYLKKKIPVLGVGGVGYDNDKFLNTKTMMGRAGASGVEILSSIINGPYGIATPLEIKKILLANDSWKGEFEKSKESSDIFMKSSIIMPQKMKMVD